MQTIASSSLLFVLSVVGPAQQPEPIPGRYLVTLRAEPDRLQPLRDAIRAGRPATEVEAIVAALDAAARQRQQPLVELVERSGGHVLQQWWIVEGFLCAGTLGLVAELRAHPRVQRVDPDAVVMPALGRSIGRANHNAAAAHALGVTGQGVTVAIVDAGIDADMDGLQRPHAAFFRNGDPTDRTGGGIAGSRLLAVHKIGAEPAEDAIGHGTGVAGVVAGARWTSDPHNERGHAPDAALVAYTIHDFRNSGSQFSTILTAWQRVAADRARYTLVAANNSYGGASDPTHPSQQAQDAATHFADVLVVVAAGNSAASTAGSQSCANGLAVGAVLHDTRVMSEVSSRGPLAGDAQRFYPDLVANGIAIESPLLDRETPGLWFSGCCTSFASPQVCGAATLYRSARRQADALETKAAILATTEDVAAKNPNPPYDTRNAYGVGYLRDDRMIALARGEGMLATVSLTAAVPDQTLQFAVQQGRRYAVAIAWHRTQLASFTWSNVDLSVRHGTTVLASSATPRNLYEKVVFTAPADGKVELDLLGKSLDVARVEVAVAAIEEVAPYTVGSHAGYGTACPGTGAQLDPAIVVPKALATTHGNSADTRLMSATRQRWLQLVDAGELPASATIHGIALRPDEQSGPDRLQQEFLKGARYDLEIDAGYAPHAPASVVPTFAANLTGTPTRVLPRQRISLPDHPGKSRGPADWVFRIPFATPFAWAPQPGQHFALDIRCHGVSWGETLSTVGAAFFVDATVFNAAVGYVRADDPAATSGGTMPRQGVVLALLGATRPALPLLDLRGRPNVGVPYALELAQARAASAAVLLLGASDQRWGAIPLPLDLTGLGAAGCKLLCSPDYTASVPTDALGAAGAQVPLPNDRNLLSLDLFHQAIVLDSGNNQLGVSMSNGIRLRIGGQP